MKREERAFLNSHRNNKLFLVPNNQVLITVEKNKFLMAQSLISSVKTMIVIIIDMNNIF